MRAAGLQGCRATGLQGCRAAGLQGCRAAGLQGGMVGLQRGLGGATHLASHLVLSIQVELLAQSTGRVHGLSTTAQLPG